MIKNCLLKEIASNEIVKFDFFEVTDNNLMEIWDFKQMKHATV